MPDNAGSASAVSTDRESPGLVHLAALDSLRADVFDYCRALVGRGNIAASATQAALTEARALLLDPRRLRAWLFALARREALTAGEPTASLPQFTDGRQEPTSDGRTGGTRMPVAGSHEILDLVYRHGIQPEDLPSVLGMPAAAAQQALARAEAEFGAGRRGVVPPVRPGLVHLDSVTELLSGHVAHLFDYCRALVGREDAAARATEVAVLSAQAVLREPSRLRAWLFALARPQALQFQTAGPVEAGFLRLPQFGHQARDVPFPGLVGDALLMDDRCREALDLVHRFGIDPAALPSVLGIPADESRALLLAAESEAGRPPPS